jgi:hypothetical protein
VRIFRTQEGSFVAPLFFVGNVNDMSTLNKYCKILKCVQKYSIVFKFLLLSRLHDAKSAIICYRILKQD